MEFTGERVVPGKVEPDLLNEHLSRYYFAAGFAASCQVLDLGCGTGYGSAILAQTAKSLIAVDISQEAITYAREHYAQAGIHFLVADCVRLPMRSGSLDLVVCFEVVEHLFEQSQLIEEISRVLKLDGLLVISTPNRLYYTDERQETNPYHTHEFDYEEFSSYLKRCFEEVQVCFQNHVSSILLGDTELPKLLNSHLEGRDPNLKTTSNFFLAVCAKQAGHVPNYQNLLYVPSAANLLREKDLWIGELESLRRELDKNISKLQKEYDDQTQWCRRLNEEVEERIAQMLVFKERAISLEQELSGRTEWAHRLDNELALCQAKLEKVKQSKLFRLSRSLRLVPKI